MFDTNSVAERVTETISIFEKLSHYFKILADMSNNGNMDILLAEYYLSNNHWSLALHHIERGFSKGGLHEAEKAQKLHRDIVSKLRGY